MSEKLKEVNIEVTEEWFMTCPHCYCGSNAPFNEANPMKPMEVQCPECYEAFILTYDRD